MWERRSNSKESCPIFRDLIIGMLEKHTFLVQVVFQGEFGLSAGHYSYFSVGGLVFMFVGAVVKGELSISSVEGMLVKQVN